VMPEEIEATDNRGRQELEKLLEYSPQHVPARVQNAFHLVARGMNRRAQQEFEYAIRVAKPDSLAARHAQWAYGWGLFRMGEYRAAIERWMEAERMHGGNPSWAPWTYAIGLWVAGDSELAVKFWTAAVRSDPERWGASRGLEREIRNWPANQRLAAEALHAEWKRRLTSGG
jgi:tetratricopeptide (TPR) repeat protein